MLELAETAPELVLPPLEPTLESVAAHAAAISVAIGDGGLTVQKAKEATAAARTMLGVIREHRARDLEARVEANLVKIRDERAVIDKVVAELHRRGHDVSAILADLSA